MSVCACIISINVKIILTDKRQIAIADVIILNKIDLVTSEEIENIEEEIRFLNLYICVYV